MIRYFPFQTYVMSIKSVNNLIPQHKYIKLEDICKNNVVDICEYSYFTFSMNLNIKNMIFIRDKLFNIYKSINDDSTVICPGDSPFKISYVYKLLKQYGHIDFQKNLRFINFPISLFGIQNIDITNYIISIIEKYNIQKDNLVFLDYIHSGESYDKIRSAFQEYFGYDFEFRNVINIDLLDVVIIGAEKENCRCVRKYSLENDVKKSLNYENLLRCNIIIFLIFKFMINDYLQIVEIFSELPDRNLNNIKIDTDQLGIITFYNIETLSVISVKGVLYRLKKNDPFPYITIYTQDDFNSLSKIRDFHGKGIILNQCSLLTFEESPIKNIIFEYDTLYKIWTNNNTFIYGIIPEYHFINSTIFTGSESVVLPIPFIKKIENINISNIDFYSFINKRCIITYYEYNEILSLNCIVKNIVADEIIIRKINYNISFDKRFIINIEEDF